jgi:hypothetical protein
MPLKKASRVPELASRVYTLMVEDKSNDSVVSSPAHPAIDTMNISAKTKTKIFFIMTLLFYFSSPPS